MPCTDVETMRHIGCRMAAAQAASMFWKILDGMRQHHLSCLYLTIQEEASWEALGICRMTQFDAGAINRELGLVLPEAVRPRGRGCLR